MTDSPEADDDDKDEFDNATYNAANPKDIKKAKKNVVNEAQEWAEGLKGLMAVPAGRRFVWLLLKKFPLKATSFHQNSMTMAMMEGQKMIGQVLDADIQRLTPANYIEMMRENTIND